MKQFFSKHQYFIVTATTIILILGFSFQVMSYLISQREDPMREPPRVAARAVHTGTVTYGSITSPVYGDGRVVPVQEIAVSTEVRGEIIEGDIPFKKGQAFSRGDTLLKVFDGTVSMQLKSQKSGFLQTIAGILPDIRIDYQDSDDRWTGFFRAISIDEPLPPLPDIASEQEKVFIASRNILTSYYTIKSNEITLDKHTIIAPFDGAFTEVSMEVGAIASPGATIARIIRTDMLELEVPVPISDARWIDTGDPVDITTDDGAVQWNGTVARIADFVDRNTQSMSVFVRLRPQEGKPLYAGQYLKAKFPGHPLDGVMRIPRNAVFNFNEVFTVADGKLLKKTVTIHKINENDLLISGLDEGTELVVEPLVNALEHSPVEVVR